MVGVGEKVLVAPLHGQKDNLVIVASGGTVTEGNYNTWTLEWYKILQDPVLSSDLPDGITSDRYDYFIDDKNDTIHMAWSDTNSKYRYGIFSCTDFSNLVVTPGTWGTTDPVTYGNPSMKQSYFLGACNAFGISHSIQTYVLYIAYNNPSSAKVIMLNIARNASLLWNHSVWDDLPNPQNTKATVETMAISPTGKYIIATTENYTSGQYRNILLYKGSYV